MGGFRNFDGDRECDEVGIYGFCERHSKSTGLGGAQGGPYIISYYEYHECMNTISKLGIVACFTIYLFHGHPCPGFNTFELLYIRTLKTFARFFCIK